MKSPSSHSPCLNRTRVLFVCIGNACRSPMAEAIARSDASDVVEASSAGLSPLGYLADLTRQTLLRNGYSVDGLTSDVLTAEAADAADLIINMSGRRFASTFKGHEKVEDWVVEDPYDSDPETYQRAFNIIQGRVHQLAQGLREKRQSQKAAR